MTKREATKKLRNLMIDHQRKLIHLPRTALSAEGQDAIKALEARGYKIASTVV